MTTVMTILLTLKSFLNAHATYDHGLEDYRWHYKGWLRTWRVGSCYCSNGCRKVYGTRASWSPGYQRRQERSLLHAWTSRHCCSQPLWQLHHISKTGVTFFKDLIYDQVKELEGKLIVKEYPTKSANVNKLKQHLEKLRRSGFEPDLFASIMATFCNLFLLTRRNALN